MYLGRGRSLCAWLSSVQRSVMGLMIFACVLLRMSVHSFKEMNTTVLPIFCLNEGRVAVKPNIRA